MKKIKKGTILLAIDPCYMDGDLDHPVLTIGKEYAVHGDVVDGSEGWFEITDDDGDSHSFDLACVEGFPEEDGLPKFFRVCNAEDGRKEPKEVFKPGNVVVAYGDGTVVTCKKLTIEVVGDVQCWIFE